MTEPVTGHDYTGHDYTAYPGYQGHAGYQGYPGYEPEPPARTVKVTHLVFGVVFLGIVALWALGTRGDISAGDVPVLIPAVLIGAGVVGLVAAALTPLLRRRQDRRGGADWAGYGAEAAQTTPASDAEAAQTTPVDPTEAAQTTPAGHAEAAQTEPVDAAEPADAGGFAARDLPPQPPAGDAMPEAPADGTVVEKGRQGPSRSTDATDRTDRTDHHVDPDDPEDPEEIR